MRATFGTAPAEADKDPGRAIGNKFKIEGFLDQAATARDALADANHFLYLCEANQLAAVDPASGGSVGGGALVGPNGHLNAFTAIGQGADKIAAFLAK